MTLLGEMPSTLQLWMLHILGGTCSVRALCTCSYTHVASSPGPTQLSCDIESWVGPGDEANTHDALLLACEIDLNFKVHSQTLKIEVEGILGVNKNF